MRIFLAIEIPENVKDRLVEVQKELASRLLGVRWEKREKLHITLVFLGEVGEEGKNGVETQLIASVQKAVKEGLEGVRGFKLILGDLGVFPSLRRPRVIWVGVKEKSKTKNQRSKIEDLVEGLEKSLGRAGFEFDKKPFHPHITIGRVKHGSGGAISLRERDWLGGGLEFEAREVVIMKSELQPTGSVYTVLSRIPLGSAADSPESGKEKS